MGETIIVIIILAAVAAGIYQNGKRTGSRKAYHVGRTTVQRIPGNDNTFDDRDGKTPVHSVA